MGANGVQHIKISQIDWSTVWCTIFISFFGVELIIKNERVSRMWENAYLSIKYPKVSRALKRALDNGYKWLVQQHFITWATFSLTSCPPPWSNPGSAPHLLVIFWTKTKVSTIFIITCISQKFQYTFFCTISCVSLVRKRKRKLGVPVNSPVRKLVILYCKVRDLYDRHFTIKKMIKFCKL